MGTHRISEDVEKRLDAWVRKKSEDQAWTWWELTFSEVIDALLKEAGY